MINNELIKNMALENGFKLKQQPTGEMELNPYVYQFAWALINQALDLAVLKNDCMINQVWFMKGTPVAGLIQTAEANYQAEVVAQNSKIEFGTDDHQTWWAHEVPFYGTVQMECINENGLVEWDIFFSGCWQGPFNSKSEAIKHLEDCIQECRCIQLKPAVIERNEDGSWIHANYAAYRESEFGQVESLSEDQLNQLQNDLFVDIEVVEMLDSFDQAPDGLIVASVSDEMIQSTNPDRSENWFIVAIFDADCGPAVMWAKQRS
ncbi:hypothetical protein NI451_07490 [Acinetobacter indicus]|nr:hypothetical protein [Acinetobacter indicus]MCO8088214.1 hypothetical protein [Acinetobacter indicus]